MKSSLLLTMQIISIFFSTIAYAEEHVEPIDLRIYRYESGAIKLIEAYFEGEIQISIWLKPDGTSAFKTVWRTGEGVYVRLDEDGRFSLISRSSMGKLHGECVEFNDGAPERFIVYSEGVETYSEPYEEQSHSELLEELMSENASGS